MKVNFGVLSLVMIGAAVVLGLVTILMTSVSAGIIYGLAVLGGGFLILMNYCRKCPHSMNNSCRHIWPGRIAKKLPYKKTGKYTFWEVSSVILTILILLIMPVMYIYDQYVLLGIYLLCWAAGVVMIRTRVCTTCFNRWCMMCPNRVKQ